MSTNNALNNSQLVRQNNSPGEVNQSISQIQHVHWQNSFGAVKSLWTIKPNEEPQRRPTTAAVTIRDFM